MSRDYPGYPGYPYLETFLIDVVNAAGVDGVPIAAIVRSTGLAYAQPMPEILLEPILDRLARDGRIGAVVGSRYCPAGLLHCYGMALRARTIEGMRAQISAWETLVAGDPGYVHGRQNLPGWRRRADQLEAALLDEFRAGYPEPDVASVDDVAAYLRSLPATGQQVDR